MKFDEIENILDEGAKFKKALATALIGASLASGAYAKPKATNYSEQPIFKDLNIRQRVEMNGGGVGVFAADAFEELNNEKINVSSDKIVTIKFEDIKTISIDKCELLGKLIVKSRQETKEINISFNIELRGTNCKTTYFANNKQQDFKIESYKHLTQTIKRMITNHMPEILKQ